MPLQVRASAAEMLDGLTPDWDEIVRRAHLTRSPADVDDVEQLAQTFVDRVMQAVRGRHARRPSAQPLKVYANGALW